jgi:cell wall-associated NlpC family hydrolase
MTWRSSTVMALESKPAPGNLVFFKEHGRVITHVGIVTGRGTVIYASSYWNKVTETRIRYIKGYAGAKRLL